MKSLFKYLSLLITGGSIYIIVEIIARGFSHWTMFVVGGICFILVGLINEITPNMKMIFQMLISALIITCIEFASGCILNLLLGLNIWDYTLEPFNLMGQISLKHSIYWFLLSYPAIKLDDFMRKEIDEMENDL